MRGQSATLPCGEVSCFRVIVVDIIVIDTPPTTIHCCHACAMCEDIRWEVGSSRIYCPAHTNHVATLSLMLRVGISCTPTACCRTA